ncbi:protein serine/threonine phosphatase 2C [Pluteus cervinus]|uniref:Protein serine/threonine phosphatase 2C n=1 Tax=Pluteus cervinus TaxID=181527 RepID=A0ACD3BCX8_9AGAR|nr:protein serine/threonine phosphatase 2C [Pluteus cervinus]
MGDEAEDRNRIVHSSCEEYANFRLSAIQYQPTDRPIEDRFSISVDSSSGRVILGVYDGHGGTATADHVREVLPSELLALPPSNAAHIKTFRKVDDAMLHAFTQDHSIFRSRSPQWKFNAQVIKSGCTALVLDIDFDTLTALYGNAGDCRAVISQGPQQPPFETTDLNAKNSQEKARLIAEHPGEDLLVVSGRLFGKLMSTRGFGDGYFKLPNGPIGNRQHRKYIDVMSSLEASNKIPMNQQYDSYFYGYKTPPYLTATPEVGNVQLYAPGFAILASDGLWDLISGLDAQHIVQEGIDSGKRDLAKHLLESVLSSRNPGDDVTIVVIELPSPTAQPEI